MRLTTDDLRLLSDVNRQFPQLAAVLEKQKQVEMEMLVVCGSEFVGVFQGRARVLGELKNSLLGRNKTP